MRAILFVVAVVILDVAIPHVSGTNASNLPLEAAQQRQNMTRSAAAKLPPSSAKVDVVPVAPTENLGFFISPHGGHVAALTQRGSRMAVTYDGVQGPPFDEILDNGTRQHVSFSADGAHYAYAARSGQEYVVMVDGKELIRLPVATTHWSLFWQAGNSLLPTLTPKGTHSYFMVRVGDSSSSDHRLYWDGRPVPSKFPSPRDLVISPDGEHFAYVSAPAVDTTGAVALIVDGRTLGYSGGSPQFTPDSRHLVVRAVLPGGEGVAILADGKPYVRAKEARVFFPSTGRNSVTVVTEVGPDRADRHFLVVDGKRVPGSESPVIPRIWFSPDGMHYAAECHLPMSKGKFMIVDGKRGQEYSSGFWATTQVVDAPMVIFSPDSSRSAYVGVSGDKQFAVVDGQELTNGYRFIRGLRFAGPSGKRFGFIASSDNSRDRWVVIDGKATQSNFAKDDLEFSADGSRYAYTTTGATGTATSQSHLRLVVDGVAEEGLSVTPLIANLPNQPVSFVLSPDGKHVVHYGEQVADRSPGFVINGKFLPDRYGLRPVRLTFTPNGKHLLWVSTVLDDRGRPAAFVIYVDGRPARIIDLPSDANLKLMTQTPGSWDMEPDGTLTVLAVEEDTIKRIRISPADDTSIETMLAPSGR